MAKHEDVGDARDWLEQLDPAERQRLAFATWGPRIPLYRRREMLSGRPEIGVRACPSSPRPRARAPRSRRTRTARASRDGPDEPEPPLRRRSSDLTPLQEAQWLSAAAFEVARDAGDRVFDTFLDIEAIRVARETARRWWRSEVA